MNCIESIEPETAAPASTPTPTPVIQQVCLPMGLLGFEQIKDFLLLSNPGEEPFRWLQVSDNPALAFVVVEPFQVLAEYRPDIPEPDVQFLGLTKPEDALVFNIVTVLAANKATINLKGPVVFNRHTHVGKQVIIANAAEYSVQHPLPVGEHTS